MNGIERGGDCAKRGAERKRRSLVALHMSAFWSKAKMPFCIANACF